MSSRLLPAYAALVTAVLLWGAMPPASKALVGVIGPWQVAFVRCLSAFVILTIVCLVVAGPDALRSAIRRPVDTFVLGLLNFLISSISTQLALQYIPASLHVVLISSSPIVLALMAMANRSMSLRGAVGAVIALIGVVAVIGGNDPRQVFSGSVDPRGLAFALVNMLSIGASQLWGRRVALRGDPLGTTALSGAAVLPFLLAGVLWEGGFSDVLNATPSIWALLGFISVLGTAVTFGLWFWALKHVSAARSAPIQYISPPVGVLVAWYFLGEALTIGLAVGTVLVLIGVALTQMSSRPGPSNVTKPVSTT